MTTWGGFHVQAVWFVTSSEGLDASAVYERIMEASPDNVQRNRVPNPSIPFLSRAAAAFDNMEFVVQIQPGRVDFVQMASEPENDELPVLFDLTTAFDRIVGTLKRAPLIEQQVARLALVATVVKPVKTYAQGAKEVFDFANWHPPFDDALDVNIQINKRKNLAKDREFNRVVSASVMSRQAVMMEFSNAGARTFQTTNDISYNARLHFDINNVVGQPFIPPSDQEPIFSAMSQEILRLSGSPKLSELEI